MGFVFDSLALRLRFRAIERRLQRLENALESLIWAVHNQNTDGEIPRAEQTSRDQAVGTAQMIGKYEIHISRTAPTKLDGWKNSCFDDEGHVLTSYARTEALAREKLRQAIFDLSLRSDGRVTRAKIELIICDIRFAAVPEPK